MIIGDEQKAFAQFLEFQIGLHGAEIIPQMQGAGRLKTRKNTHVIFLQKLKNYLFLYNLPYILHDCKCAALAFMTKTLILLDVKTRLPEKQVIRSAYLQR